jgi:hypothetical protein
VTPGYNDEIATLPLVARNDGPMKGQRGLSLNIRAYPVNPYSCFDRLSANGNNSMFSIRIPFALSLSKGERRFAGQAHKEEQCPGKKSNRFGSS